MYLETLSIKGFLDFFKHANSTGVNATYSCDIIGYALVHKLLYVKQVMRLGMYMYIFYVVRSFIFGVRENRC